MFSKLKYLVFAPTRKKELDKLFETGFIKLVNAREAQAHPLYHENWVANIKSDGPPKSRIVFCADTEKFSVIIYDPIVQRKSARIGFCFDLCFQELQVECRYVAVLSTHPDAKLKRPLYLEIPHELHMIIPRKYCLWSDLFMHYLKVY